MEISFPIWVQDWWEDWAWSREQIWESNARCLNRCTEARPTLPWGLRCLARQCRARFRAPIQTARIALPDLLPGPGPVLPPVLHPDRNDISIKIFEQQHVELLRSHYHLQSTVIHNYFTIFDFRIFPAHLANTVQEKAVRKLHDVRLVNGGNLLAAPFTCMFKRKRRDSR